jgi:DNA polymerase/3'-5' exonuclease PolX
MYEYKEIDDFIKYIKSKISGLYFVGSYARQEPVINDLDIVSMRNINDIIDDFKNLYPNLKIIKQGEKYGRIKISKLFIDIWKAKDKEELKSLKVIRSLDLGHNIAYRKIAGKLGLSLNDYG